MAQAAKDTRVALFGDEARQKLLEGAKASYDVVTTTYGPKGFNCLIEKPFGRPVLSRDGVTVAREVYFQDRAKNMGAQLLMEASETTNRNVGDGTSATVALSYHLLRRGIQAIAAGQHPMEVSRGLREDGTQLLKALDKMSKPIKDGQLVQVATVSSGDPLLGQLIAEAIEYVGPDGGITAEKAPVDSVEREYVDGYYLQSGFQALQMGRKELTDPFVIVSSRRLSSAADVIELMTKTAQSKQLTSGTIPRFLFVGTIEDAAYNLICDNINRGTIDAVIIKTPASFGDMGKQLLEDIAIYAGCEPITDSTNLKEFNQRYVGTVDKVVATKSETTIFADNTTEAVQVRVAEIKDQVGVEISDAVVERLRDRIAKLEGKIALFKIGGATETAKEELEFRIEDAIQATKAAVTGGVVPGGGITLLNLAYSAPISDMYTYALSDVFKQLLLNANLPAELAVDAILKAPAGHGYNLREENGELVDMVAEGVLDPTKVVSEVIKNATEVVANMLTIGSVLIFVDSEV